MQDEESGENGNGHLSEAPMEESFKETATLPGQVCQMQLDSVLCFCIKKYQLDLNLWAVIGKKEEQKIEENSEVNQKM